MVFDVQINGNVDEQDFATDVAPAASVGDEAVVFESNVATSSGAQNIGLVVVTDRPERPLSLCPTHWPPTKVAAGSPA